MGKEILIWLGIFIVGSLVVNFLIYPDSFDSFKESVAEILSPGESSYLSSVSNLGAVDNLDVVDNPGDYVGEELIIKDTHLCFTNGIVVYREDGTRSILYFKYKRDINEHYKYDLYGKVEKSGEEYYFNVERAVQRVFIDDFNYRRNLRRSICD